jgi:hypothetical protein
VQNIDVLVCVDLILKKTIFTWIIVICVARRLIHGLIQQERFFFISGSNETASSAAASERKFCVTPTAETINL